MKDVLFLDFFKMNSDTEPSLDKIKLMDENKKKHTKENLAMNSYRKLINSVELINIIKLKKTTTTLCPNFALITVER